MLPDDEKILKTYGSDENPDIYQLKLINNGYQHQYSKNCLQLNNGGSFSETALLSGVAATDWSWSALFADFDNDGNKDLFFTSGVMKRTTDLDYVKFISNAYVRRQMDKSLSLDDEALDKMPDGISHNYLFKGDGKLLFNDESKQWGLQNDKGYFTGAAYADLDNDGDLDMIVNAINSKARIYKNNRKNGNYLTFSLKGNGPNTQGIGVKAWLFTHDTIGKKMQYLQTATTRGFLSAPDTRLHFGLGVDSTADSILIVWPSKKFQLLKNVAANRSLIIDEKDATGEFVNDKFFPKEGLVLEEVTLGQKSWTHKENYIRDFNVQYLIPQAKSTKGPKLAVADVNNDDLEDFYVCGAAGQTGTLMIRQKNGGFVPGDTSIFSDANNAEETKAIFFDANGDKFPDLYVVTGGNEYSGKTPVLLDRLYINDGKGNFSRSLSGLPLIYQNKSCAEAADIDSDGDNDLFIGVHANATAYGIPQTSHLLLNDGKGNFSDAPKALIDLENIGMVNAAAFADINKDGLKDLVIAGEWMPLTIFINEKKSFRKETIDNSSGWWQTIHLDDADGDGNLDILAGNWGLNNKFTSSKDGPVKLYTADFDKNGRVDQLLSYTFHGKEYPFLAKDEVERQLPLLKKHYLYYSEYAGVPMKTVFFGWIDTIQPLVAVRLASAICFGNGSGGFEIRDLPADLQKAPIFCFEKIKDINGSTSFIAGGNFYDVIPYEGRYDAQPLAIFTVNRNRNTHYVHQSNLSAFDLQVRDVTWISIQDDVSWIIVAGNNAPLKFLKYR